MTIPTEDPGGQQAVGLTVEVVAARVAGELERTEQLDGDLRARGSANYERARRLRAVLRARDGGDGEKLGDAIERMARYEARRPTGLPPLFSQGEFADLFYLASRTTADYIAELWAHRFSAKEPD